MNERSDAEERILDLCRYAQEYGITDGLRDKVRAALRAAPPRKETPVDELHPVVHEAIDQYAKYYAEHHKLGLSIRDDMRYVAQVATRWASVENDTAKRVSEDTARIVSLQKAVEAKQAVIDRLMLEYCPDEMTQEQIENWKRHQKAVSPEQEAAIERALRSETGGNK